MYFFSNRKDKNNISPIIVIVGLCTFSLGFLFTNVEIGIGIGFGLFAVFSILRFRAQVFSINAIIFLFATITLSLLDIIFPIDKIKFLLFFQIIILSFYLIASNQVNKNENVYINSIDFVIEYTTDFKLENTYLRQQIMEKLKINEFDFKVSTVNIISKEILLKVFY
jgi:Domain of unknown function (DUF4956)